MKKAAVALVICALLLLVVALLTQRILKSSNEPLADMAPPPAAPTAEVSNLVQGDAAATAPETTGAQVTNADAQVSNAEAQVPPAATDSAALTATANAAKAKVEVKDITPSLQTLREQVAANAHITPQALTEFSVALSERVEALTTEEDARLFMDELEGCVTGKTGDGQRNAENVQTLCLLNAQKTKNKFPNLGPKYEGIRAKATEDSRITESMFK
jgi:hypothetical protein